MKVLVALSGGVDSSVAAALLQADGHQVIGVTLKQWENRDGSLPTAGCCTVRDAEDARRVAAQLNIPYYVLDYVEPFRRAVVEPFASAYRNGHTPNPCIECNRRVRFQALLERVSELGCDWLATGHHARVTWHPTGFRLRKGRDAAKDQSYVLHMLTQAQLARVRFPVGELTKAEVRAYAAAQGLRTAAKPESQEICFVGDRKYSEFLAEEFPEAARPGLIRDRKGEVIGSHSGIAGFTIGQRRGTGVAAGERRYVVAVDVESATVTLGERDDLLVSGCRLHDISFVLGHPPLDRHLQVKLRYRGDPVGGWLREGPTGSWEVVFDRAQPAVAKGQSAVFYRGEDVLGGGVVINTFTNAA